MSQDRVTNPVPEQPLFTTRPQTWRRRLARLRGSSITFDLKPYAETLAEIERHAEPFDGRDDLDLASHLHDLAEEARSGEPLESLLPSTYALVREASRRAVGLYPYDVQVIAAIALHRGHVVEMQTGEGKTLAAVMPACLNALTGRGVHILTFNDYLARRDAEWMGPIYRLLGLTVGRIQAGMAPAERRAAYGADVTYVTAKEAGFDHLRDLKCTDPADLAHRPFHFALVDEADSLLIDEARVPLVLAGNTHRATSNAPRLAALAEGFEPGVDFKVEEYSRNVELTEAGFDRAEAELGCGNLLAEANYLLLTELNCALHAHALLRRDIDYIVRADRIQLVDEFTGRIVEDRHWPDGLQAALEAKEGLVRRDDGRILGSITLEHLLAAYPKISGMTGTAQAAAEELKELYALDVVVIPTHRPMIRRDQPDVIFTHREAKEAALVEEIRRIHATDRPTLVGTLTVEESERLAARLQAAGVPCQVLNAKNDTLEAKIIARAGDPGAVTISTNMAGRGTDIRLGQNPADHQRIAELGGLYVIGTNRHESLRVDLQLRGRAGRQGDPGETRFFLSLEDDLLQRYGIRQLIPKRLLPEPRPEPIESPVVQREIARAQRIIEGQNLEIRRTLLRFATPIEEQRQRLQGERQALLRGAEPTRWQRRPERYRQLIDAAGRETVRAAETATTLFHIDRAWSDHLATVASLREGIHLVSLGGDDPLTTFQVKTAQSYRQMLDTIDDAVSEALDQVEIRDGTIDLAGVGIKGPSSTWTYLTNDDAFRTQMGRMLTGPGNTTMAISAAFVAGPFLILWALADRYLRKRGGSTAGKPAETDKRF